MWNFLIIAAGALTVMCSPVLALLADGPPQPGSVALVISAPWGPHSGGIAARAGLQEVSPEQAPMGAFVMLKNSSSVDRLYSQGAWLVIDGRKVLELCAN